MTSQSPPAAEDGRNRFATLFEALPDPTWLKSVNGELLACNRAYADLVGQPMAALVGRCDTEVVGADMASGFAVTDRQALAGDSPVRCDEWLNFPSLGARRLFQTVKTRLLDDAGNIVGVLGSARDITAQYEKDREARHRAAIHRATIEQANDSIALVDATTGRFVEFNPAAHTRLGYSRDEFARLHVVDIEAAHSPEEVVAATERLKREGRGIFESRHRHKDGHVIDVRVSAHRLTLDGHDFLVSMWSDISERKAMEARLRESEERFRHLFEESVQAITLVEDGRFVAANRAALDMLGYTGPEQLVGRSPAAISPPCQPDGQSSAAKSTLLIERVFARGGIQFEWEHLRADGTTFLVEVLLTTIEHGGKRLLYVTWRDITAQKAAERELDAYRHDLEAQVATRAAEQQAIFDTATSGIALIKERVLVHCNRKLHELFGWPPGAMAGQPTAIWYPDESAHAIGGEAIYERIWAGEAHTREQELRRRDGGRFWARLTGRAVDTRDRAKGSVWVIDDITAERAVIEDMRKARKLAEEAARMKSDFVANMSHEIRTPMNTIIGMTHLVLKTELAAKQRDYLNKIQGSSQHLLGILNDILDFSKIEAGKLAIEHIAFDLEKVLDHVAGMLTEKTAAKGLELILDVSPDVPNDLVGDPLRIGQVLINYANNAVKFTARGEIAIRVAVARRIDKRALLLRFEVSDTGIGIAADRIDRLFQSFEQVDSSTTRQYGGTGLGLAISKRLAELMGGEVGVDSVPDRGSTFWFTVRLDHGQNQTRRPPPEPRLHGRRVLVVDDNEHAGAVLAAMLRAMTFDVAAAASGRAALDEIARAAAAGTPYEVVFIDERMPELDGLATARAIAALGLRDPPRRVLVTTHGREDLMAAASRAGMDEVLGKPLSASLLFDTMMRLLGANRSQRSDETPPADSAAPVDLTGVRILLVEDNALNQEVARDLLAITGARVEIADDGAAALWKVREADYDLVLMDMQMPVMDGLAATRAIRALPGFAALPIVAMTANAMASDRERCIAAGMNDHIAKPIDPDDLWAKLSRWAPARIKKNGPAPAAASVAPQTLLPTTEETGGNALNAMRDIAGLNVDTGLRLVMGREKFYLSLLAKFAAGQRDFRRSLRVHLAADDWHAAERLTHTLKSMAGQIGAAGLYAGAERLEQALRRRQAPADLKAPRSAVEEELERLIDAIASRLPKSSVATAPGTHDAAACAAVCAELRQQLAADDFGCGQLLAAHADTLRAGLGEHYPWIAEAINGFNFSAALDWLDEALNARRKSTAAPAVRLKQASDALAGLVAKADGDGESR